MTKKNSNDFTFQIEREIAYQEGMYFGCNIEPKNDLRNRHGIDDRDWKTIGDYILSR